ncbi:MAG: sialate O-acetylesterase [Phycisphaerae bacterium]|nr:sialate O-acetylesterase [Phycisphaerae bacterium]
MTGVKYKSVLYSIWGRIIILILAVVPVSGTSICQAGTTKVFLLAGQSNMVGWCSNSDLPLELQQPRPDIQIYWGGVWTYLRPGLGGNSSCFGPEITFCRDIVDAQPDEDIIFIKYAVSGTSLWYDWRPISGVQYINFMNAVNNALLSISEPEIVGMIWMQGESDAWESQSTLEHAQEYQQNLANFIQYVRTDLAVPDLPFVIGRISQSPVWTWGDIVRQAQANGSQTIANTALVDTDDLPLKTDNIHYTTGGTVTLGTRFAEGINTLALPNTNSFSSDSEGTVLTWRYDIPDGNNRVLVVGVCGEDDDPCDLATDSVKYNGVVMYEAADSKQLAFSDGTYVMTQLFYLLENDLPAADDYRLDINFAANVNKRCGGAVTLNGIDQEPPLAVATNSTQDANSISTDITIEADGAWIIDIVGCGSNGTLTADVNQITEFNIDGNNIATAGSIKPVSLAEVATVGWNLTDSNCAIAHSAVAFTTFVNTISGHVRRADDTPIEGVTVTLDFSGDSDTTDPNGYYEVPVVHNWFGKVAPVKDGCLFGPSERIYSNVAADLPEQDYKDISIYDLDTDGFINWGDIEIIHENWLMTGPNVPGDLYKDEDNIVNFLDFAELARVW